MAHDGLVKGKVALVTGGSRGIGRQIALALAKNGADVALNYRNSEAEAQRTMSEVQEYGVRCLIVRADVSQAGEVARMVETIKDTIGSVQILVNNAGVARPQALE